MKTQFPVRFGLLVLVAMSLSACAQFEKWTGGEAAPRRSFTTRVDWVKSTPTTPNMGFRKINRFAPLFFEHPKEGPILIQANAIDGVKAYRRRDGQLIWSFPVPNGVEASAILQGDRLFFGASDGMFYSISAVDGSSIWSFPTRIENIAEPVYSDGLVYFLTGANTFYALEAESGKQAWLYSRQDTQALSIRGGSKPAVSGGSVFVGFSDGAIVSLNAKTGALKWEQALNRNKRFRDLDSGVVVEGDILYVSGFDDGLYALRTATGDVAWRHAQGGYAEPLVTKDRIFYAGTDSELIALEKSTGKKLWGYKLATGLPSSPSLYKGMVVFGESQGGLRIVDAANGKLVRFFEPGSGIQARPVTEEAVSRIYFISTEGNIYALRAAWTLAPLIPYL